MYISHDKGITVQSEGLEDNPVGILDVNVEGKAGRELSGVDIRASASIHVLVEATLPENESDLTTNFRPPEFMVNGVSSIARCVPTART